MGQMELDSANLHLVDHTTARLTVFIQPAFANQVKLGVTKELDKHVLRYMEDQQAVLLGYSNVKVVTKQALLSSYIPYLTIHCTAELVLFKPNPGNMLVGRVHSVSPGQLNVLVLGGINACVTEEEMPEGFRFDTDNNCWVQHGDYSRAILVGDIVACKVLSAPVTDIDQEQLLFNLDASMLPEGAGLLQQQPQIQQQRRAKLVASVTAVAAKAETKAPRKAARAEEKAAAKAARKEEKAAAKAARKAEKWVAKEQAKAEKKTAKRKQREVEAAGQHPAKRQKHSEQQQVQQQPPPSAEQLQQAGSTPAADSSSGHSPVKDKREQQSEQKSSKRKHKEKHKDKEKRNGKQ